MSDAQKMAGEILNLTKPGRVRTASEEKRLSDLYVAFGDYEASATALIRAAAKGDPDALREMLKNYRG